MYVKIVLLLTSLMLGTQAMADQTIAQQHVSDAQLVGKARFKVLFWRVFDAELYAQNGEFNSDKPFALSLSYLRKIKGSEIVAKSISEIQSQSTITSAEANDWESQLKAIIPDVDTQTTITGVRDVDAHTLFYNNDVLIGEIENERFTRAFFNIWLGEKTSEPKLRNGLLNLNN